MLLPDEFVERPRTHAVSQRPRLVASFVTTRDVLEKTHEFIHHRGTEELRLQNPALDTVLEHSNVEVDQQSDPLVGQTHVSEKLGFMYR